MEPGRIDMADDQRFRQVFFRDPVMDRFDESRQLRIRLKAEVFRPDIE